MAGDPKRTFEYLSAAAAERDPGLISVKWARNLTAFAASHATTIAQAIERYVVGGAGRNRTDE